MRYKLLLPAVGAISVAVLVAVLALPATSPGVECTPPYCPSYTLTVKKVGTGSGKVTSSPGGIDCGSKCSASYEQGTKVTLTAAAASGSSFVGWGGGGCSGKGSCVLTIKANTAVTAIFSVHPPPAPPPVGTLKVAPKAPVKARKAVLKTVCTGGGPCRGTLKLKYVAKKKSKRVRRKKRIIGKASFNVAAGASKKIKVKLSRAAMKKLKAHKRLKAKVSGNGVLSSTVKLRLAKKKRKR